MEMIEQREALAEAQAAQATSRKVRALGGDDARAREGGKLEAGARVGAKRRSTRRARRASSASCVTTAASSTRSSAIEDAAEAASMTLFEIFDPKARAAAHRHRSRHDELARRVRARTSSPSSSPTATASRSCRASCTTTRDGDVVVGAARAARAAEHPRDTIVSVKRFMGRGADDPETRRLGPYEFVDADEPGEANIVRFRVAADASSRRSR